MRRFRSICTLVIVIASYTTMWALTPFVGGYQIRKQKLSTMYQPEGLAGFEEVSGPGIRGKGRRVYYCRTTAYAPFIIRVDYGWNTGSLSGDGGSELYFWGLGATSQIRVLEHWGN